MTGVVSGLRAEQSQEAWYDRSLAVSFDQEPYLACQGFAVGYCNAWEDRLGAAPVALRGPKAYLDLGGDGVAAVGTRAVVGHWARAHWVREQASKLEGRPVAAVEEAADLDIGVSVAGYSEVWEKPWPVRLWQGPRMFVDVMADDPIHRESHWPAVSSRTGASDRHFEGVVAQDEQADRPPE